MRLTNPVGLVRQITYALHSIVGAKRAVRLRDTRNAAIVRRVLEAGRQIQIRRVEVQIIDHEPRLASKLRRQGRAEQAVRPARVVEGDGRGRDCRGEGGGRVGLDRRGGRDCYVGRGGFGACDCAVLLGCFVGGCGYCGEDGRGDGFRVERARAWGFVGE